MERGRGQKRRAFHSAFISVESGQKEFRTYQGKGWRNNWKTPAGQCCKSRKGEILYGFSVKTRKVMEGDGVLSQIFLESSCPYF